MSRDREYAVRLFLAWLNERYRRAFALQDTDGDVIRATDASAGDVAVFVAPLFEGDEAWDKRRDEISARLDEQRPGSYLLWVPPGGRLPDGEPDESEFVRRVVLAASKLASGRAGEVRLPVPMMLGKVKEEGGYASVTGGLSRHWTEIAAGMQGSYYLDSRRLNRFTRNEDERKELFSHIGLLSQGLGTGDAIEFEHDDAWTLQRLPRSEGMADGWAITGCPPGFSPDDGGAVRRLLRKRLADASAELSDMRDAVRVLLLVGAYEYIEGENAGPSLRGFDPALTAGFDVIVLVSDGEVKPLRLSRLPFAAEAKP